MYYLTLTIGSNGHEHYRIEDEPPPPDHIVEIVGSYEKWDDAYDAGEALFGKEGSTFAHRRPTTDGGSCAIFSEEAQPAGE